MHEGIIETMQEERPRADKMSYDRDDHLLRDNLCESRVDILKKWDITIKVITIGCIISVGCKSFAFSTLEEGLKELQEYYKDPAKLVNKWERIEKQLNQIN